MQIYFHFIILDSKGEIFNINGLEAELHESLGIFKMRDPYGANYPPQEEHDKSIQLACSLDKDDVELPERLKDGFTVLVAVTGAEWTD